MHATLPRIITFIHIYIYVYLRARMKKVPCPTLLYSNTTVALSPLHPQLKRCSKKSKTRLSPRRKRRKISQLRLTSQ